MFLGHVLSYDGIAPDPNKVKDLLEFQVPSDVKTLQRFLGLVQWFKKFVKHLAHIAKPLFTLLQKETAFIWTDTHQKAFEKLKNSFVSPPILQLPRLTEKHQFVLATDASDFAIGAVLYQIHLETKERGVLGYASRVLNSAEINYATTEKEALAIV